MIPIYIGISHRFDIAKGLTESSILKHTSSPVSITHLYPETEEGCTGFTNVRYTIKKGIYLDVDMLVLADIAELWEYRQPGKWVCMRDGSTEVSVIDCDHNCQNKHEEHLLPKVCSIPKEWNTTDAYRVGREIRFLQHIPEKTKIFHFTSLAHQPWFYDHPSQAAIDLYNEHKPC